MRSAEPLTEQVTVAAENPKTGVRRVFQSSILLEEIWLLYLDGDEDPLSLFPDATTEELRAQLRQFDTEDGAVAYGAALLNTGQAEEFEVRRFFRQLPSVC